MPGAKEFSEFLIKEAMPLFWCPGCGNGIILGAVLRAFKRLGLRRQDIVIVTGIGCFGKADDYINTNTFHGTHGRALAVATGIKAFKPELTVVALMGDGDCATIGGNHLIHAARRNIGVTAIVANNYNYGMTGGQLSATTPDGDITSTSIYGNPESDFDLCKLVAAAGANYVARTTVYHVHQLQKFVLEAIQKKGFSMVEVASTCPTYYGRYNGRGSEVDLMAWIRDRAVSISNYERLSPEERENAIVTGKFVDVDRPDFNARYKEIQEKARAKFAKEEVASIR